VISGDCADFTYQPANYGSGDSWPAPAPPGPYSTSLDAFDGEVANGTWKLYVVDDVQPNSGDIEGGWSLSIDTGPVDAAIPGNGTSGPASFYPATRTVSGQDGLITDVNVAIDGIWHQNPDDLDLLLVGPQGQRVILMSDACGSFGVKAFGWVWDDEAPAPMPDVDGTNICGTRFHRPADYEPGDAWPTPATRLPRRAPTPLASPHSTAPTPTGSGDFTSTTIPPAIRASSPIGSPSTSPRTRPRPRS
jgi:hypothetical protein